MKQIIPTKRYNRDKTTSIEGGMMIVRKFILRFARTY